ncbi:type VI secretion system secreted protein VgrG [Cupriavidus sp. YR651]|uniref:type VI secretion system Vgr family protein n=1 Tax=Cupriavidus sp. YR651 TaxID=1855315 RepID=UPI000889FC87|nr:type VI secretion system Vgr family protein [Cupriavidus sp. YR651]SDD22062.1 type VI secretion system secreted protein VgrG [Cupriavidus sp. YR651]
MADLVEGLKQLKHYDGALREKLTGRQTYFLEVPGTASASALSVIAFEAVERMGDPYIVTVQLTHPLELDRADYLGKAATFRIDPADGTAPRKFAGCITRFSRTRQTRDFCGYEVVVEPRIARLRLTRASRIYQQQTAPQIIEAILRRHDLQGHQFIFKLRRTYPEHKFRLQHQMSDLAFIRLLCEQEGLYFYFSLGKFGEMVVFGDDIDHYLYQPELRVPYRETAGLESGQEAVFSLETHARTMPESFRVADFNPDQAWERPTGEANVARKEKTTYGQSYVYGTHHLDFEGAKWEAQLRHEAEFSRQLIFAGESNVLALCPARILRTDQTLPDAPNGLVVTEVIHSGARDAAYCNTFRAIPSDRRFRLPMDEDSWPRIHGTLSARVTSPGQYKYAYLTQDGHYVVRFDFDFDTWPNGGESVPLRLAKPFAGALQTGFHFPLVDGTYVDVAFRDGNPNKPYIAHVQHNSQHTDLITNQDRWLSRNVIRTQSNNKLRFEDWAGQESIKLSTDFGGKTQLNLGYLVDHQKKKRGNGFELRTSGWGAIRGGKGLLVSADDQPKANGQQLDMDAAQGLLQQALQQSEALASAAKAAQAIAADYARQKALLDDTLKELRKAAILVSAPAGMALVSGADLQLSAAENLIATAGGNADLSIVKRFTVAAGELVSIFAQKLGIKLFAARGKVEIQAQSDEMRLLADRNMTITSANGRVVIEAREELLLKCGGSYLSMSSTGIEDGTRGDRTIRSAAFSRQGPSSLAQQMNSLPKTAFNDPYVLRNKITGEVLKHQPYEIVREDGTRIKGLTDEMGRTAVQKSHDVEGILIRVLGNQKGAA